MSTPAAPSAPRGRPRRPVRRAVLGAVLLLVLAVGGERFALWSGAPAEAAARDCVVHAAPVASGPSSGSRAAGARGPVPEPAATGRRAAERPGAERPAPSPAAATPAAEPPGTLEQRGGTVTDASCLTRTPVYGVARPRTEADVREALAFAADHDLAVSVVGTGHALGGQASSPGGLVLDVRHLDAVVVDADRRTATVGAGAPWRRVLEAVHPTGLSVATMPGIDVLSVGGTVSVNAHGLDFRAGSLSSTVRSLRVMLADGTVHRVSRDSRPDLFRSVVGGYGLLGVVLDVELDLVDSEVYRLRSRVVDVRDLPRVAADAVADERVRMAYTHLSTSPDSLLREAIAYTYERVDTAAAEPVPALRSRGSDRLGRLVLNLARTGDLGQRLKWAVQRDVLPHVRGCTRARDEALRESEACLVGRNGAMYESLGLLRHRLPQYTDVLHEYFLPPDALVPFLDDLRTELGRHDAELLNASVRIVRREDVTLDYAGGDRLSVVLYLSQRVSEQGNADMADLTRVLLASALDRGGTFYLPYQQHYTREQVRRAYPRIDEFVATKRRYDPDLRFRNSLWARYA